MYGIRNIKSHTRKTFTGFDSHITNLSRRHEYIIIITDVIIDTIIGNISVIIILAILISLMCLLVFLLCCDFSVGRLVYALEFV